MKKQAQYQHLFEALASRGLILLESELKEIIRAVAADKAAAQEAVAPYAWDGSDPRISPQELNC